jgi:predicted Zn-dependent peptidase
LLKIKDLVAIVFALFIFDAQAKHNVIRFTLKNGLQVICIIKKSAPIIFFSIWYRCGSKNDAISKSGVAHYLEHMAFSSNKMEFIHN